MTLEPDEFIRRFLMHVLPKSFHRIRHYGRLANGGLTRAQKIAGARELIAATGQVGPQPKPPPSVGPVIACAQGAGHRPGAVQERPAPVGVDRHRARE